MLLRTLLLLALLALPLAAQPHVEPVFGIGDKEFLIGGWNLPMPNTAETDSVRQRRANIHQVIDWARSMGVSVFRLPEYYGYSIRDHKGMLHALLRHADAARDLRFYLTHIPGSNEPTYGLEAQFLLVPDSVVFRDWQNRFLHLAGGVTVVNDGVRERRYERGRVPHGATIADSIVIDWRPERTSWWNQVYVDSLQAWCVVPPEARQREPGRMFGELWSAHDKGAFAWRDTNYVVVTGHLDERSRAHADSTLLWIDLSYDIGRGETYHNPRTRSASTASSNLSVPCTTLAVRVRDLATRRSVSIPFDASRCSDTVAGPLHDNAGVSRRIGMRVRYAGNATVALRSIALRDWMGEQVLSETPEGVRMRRALLRDMRALATEDGMLHRSVIGFATDGEQSPIQAAAVRRVNAWLQESYVDWDRWNARRDTLDVWLEGLHVPGAHHRLSSSGTWGRLTMVVPEFHSTQDAREGWLRRMLVAPGAPFAGVKPAIAEHNGGKFGLPELPLDANAIEALERQVQVRHLRQYLPDAPHDFHFQSALADDARLARDLRKRLVVVPFASSNVLVNMNTDFAPERGTISIDRIQEPAELRGAVNVSLAMGAKGIFWQVLTHGTDILDPHVVARGDTIWTGRLVDWPIAGKFVGDTARDRYDTLWFSSKPARNDGMGDFLNTPRVGIPDFWTGWRTRSRAVREHNRWLARVGPELVKLTWRDAYSIHAQRPLAYTTSYEGGCGTPRWIDAPRSTPARALPASEIVTRVTAHNPRTGVVDSDTTTYVELGLFEPLDAAHHIVVVNRRIFEPTDDIAPGARRDAMVALAGTRTVTLQLNLPRGARYRVREIEPDVAPLPGATATRTPLDVVVAGDAEVAITLGPGRAALVRIARDRQE
jgi:hypothetical protein